MSTISCPTALFVTACSVLLPVMLKYIFIPLFKNNDLRKTHKKLGLEPSQSNLRSQFSTEHEPSQGKPILLQSLWIYPIKSCQGIELESSRVLPYGLEFDRLYTFAQEKTVTKRIGSPDTGEDQYKWEFITQRTYPLLASIKVELWQPYTTTEGPQNGSAHIVFRFPWRHSGLKGILPWVVAKLTKSRNGPLEREIKLPLQFPSDEEIKQKRYTFDECTIWKDTVTALNMEKALPPELTSYLGARNRITLFRIAPGRLRELYRCAPTKDDAGYQPVTCFQDAYPLHLMNISSVRDLASRIKLDDILPRLEVERFRANIVSEWMPYCPWLLTPPAHHKIPSVTGAAAYDEDAWKLIRFKPAHNSNVKETLYHVSCRAVRCKQPNVDQKTGAKHQVEPFKAMRTHRRVDEGAPLKGCMGMEMTPLFAETGIPTNLEATLTVGMPLQVIEKGSHFYIDS